MLGVQIAGDPHFRPDRAIHTGEETLDTALCASVKGKAGNAGSCWAPLSFHAGGTVRLSPGPGTAPRCPGRSRHRPAGSRAYRDGGALGRPKIWPQPLHSAERAPSPAGPSTVRSRTARSLAKSLPRLKRTAYRHGARGLTARQKSSSKRKPGGPAQSRTAKAAPRFPSLRKAAAATTEARRRYSKTDRRAQMKEVWAQDHGLTPGGPGRM